MMNYTASPWQIAGSRRWLLLTGFLLASWLTGAGTQAQAPAWQLALPHPGVAMASATDAAGNVYVAGYFQGTARFGSTILTSTAGTPDVFVAKWSPATQDFVWAVRGAGTRADRATGLAVSGSNVYVYGEFLSPELSFGSQQLFNASSMGAPAPPISNDLFVLKLTDTGSAARVEWGQRAGSGWNDYATGLAVSSANVYLTGYFDGLYTLLGTSRFFNTGSATSSDGFVARLTDAGNSGAITWAQQLGGPDYEAGVSVAASGSTVYVAGFFGSPSVSWGGHTLTRTGSDDGFVAKLTAAGSSAGIEWLQALASSGSDMASAVAVSGSGVLVAGSFSGAALTLGSTPLTNAASGSTDVFVARLQETSGSPTVAWAVRAGGTGQEVVRGMVAAGGGAYLTGDLGTAPAGFGSTTLTSAGGIADVYVARVQETGSSASFAWALSAGGPGVDSPHSVVVSSGRVYISGVAAAPAAFGTLALSAAGGFLAAVADPVLASVPNRKPAQVQIYPNPASGQVEVQVPAAAEALTGALYLHDAAGRLVRAALLPVMAGGSRWQVSLQGLAPGVYQLQVVIGNSQHRQPLAVY